MPDHADDFHGHSLQLSLHKQEVVFQLRQIGVPLRGIFAQEFQQNVAEVIGYDVLAQGSGQLEAVVTRGVGE